MRNKIKLVAKMTIGMPMLTLMVEVKLSDE